MKMIPIPFAVVAAAAFCVSQAVTDSQWAEFMAKHGKVYPGGKGEEHQRRLIWEENVKKIQAHNEIYDKGKSTFYLGENEFIDMTPKEFFKGLNSCCKNGSDDVNVIKYTWNGVIHNPNNKFMPKVNQSSLPLEINWVQKGYVTEVKNQYGCGSSWAFSATGVLEGAHFKNTGKLVSLSEKNVMDCSWKFGNNGCEGGSMEDAFRYVISNKGIETEKSYPYSPYNDVTCRYNASHVGATAAGYRNIPFGSESDLKLSSAMIGPVAVWVDADHFSFMTYKGGLYDQPDCSHLELSQAMLVVGYGTITSNATTAKENRQGRSRDFWLVKNSFGKLWGENGYIKMSRNKNNQCGIASRASYVLV